MDNRNKSGAISQIAVTLILKHYQKKLVAKWNFRPTDGSERVTVFQQPRDKLFSTVLQRGIDCGELTGKRKLCGSLKRSPSLPQL
jgi:hypothetical protein